MNAATFNRIAVQLTRLAGRRTLLAAVSGAAVARVTALAPAHLDAKGKRRKRKKKTFCRDGETVRVRADKKKKQSLIKRGATKGACPACPDLATVASLAAAIAAAPSGATLRLCAGLFSVTGTLLIEKDLTLVGAGKDLTILDGQDLVQVLRINDGIVTLQDLTVTRANAGDVSGGGILIMKGDVTLRGVTISQNTTNIFGGGVFIAQGTLALQAETAVTGNSATNGGGIYTQSGAVTLAAGTIVSGNEAINQGGGIFTLAGGVTLPARSRVSDNTAAAGGGIFRATLGNVALSPGSIVVDNDPDNCDPDNGACI